MSFKSIQSYFKFTKEQRTGILLLFTIIIILQCVYFLSDFSNSLPSDPQKQKWIALQAEVDSMKNIDKYKAKKIFLFNPNFITDYKGYKLGMSVAEIDRLLEFRKANTYVNSALEFQLVTQVSDSLLKTMQPFFKFPEWVKNNKKINGFKNFSVKAFPQKEKIDIIDINLATKEDLIKVYGIGEAISMRILKHKEVIGGFISMAILLSGTIVRGEFSYSFMSAALSEKLGSWVGLFFAIGLFSAGFTSAITAPLAANVTVLSVADTNDKYYHYYKFVWVGVMLVGFIFGISGVKPIPIIILAQVLNGLLLPLVAIFIVLIVNDKKFIPQAYRNTIFMNLALLLVVGITTFLGINNIEKAITTALTLSISSELSLWIMSSISMAVVLILGLVTLRK